MLIQYFKRSFIFFMFLFFSLNAFAQTLVYKGILKEKGTGKKINNALVIDSLEKNNFVNVDNFGYFEIKVTDKLANFIIRSDNFYDKIIPIESLSENKNNEIYLEPLPDIVGTGIIRAKVKQEVSQNNIQQEEIANTAGTGGDAVKSVQTLPSVSPAAPGSANIVVRGGDTSDNKFYYDDLQLPFIFHLGGINTVIPTKMIDFVDFYPGGFSSLYGDAIGGIIQLNSKNIVPENFSGSIEAGLTQSSLYLEGSLFKTNTNCNNLFSFLTDKPIGYRIGFRRTYFELYSPILNKIPKIGFVTFPQATDYQFILNGAFNKGTWQIYLLGAADRIGIAGNFGPNLNSQKKQALDLFNYYETSGFKIKKNLPNNFGLQVSFQQLFNKFSLDIGENKIAVDQYNNILKATLTKYFNSNIILTFGLVPQFEKDVVDFNFYQLGAPGTSATAIDPITSPRFVDIEHLSNFYTNAFVDLNMKLFNRIIINPGLYLLKGTVTNSKTYGIDPRIGARFEINEFYTIKSSFGYYSQRPNPQISTPDYGNPNLEFEKTKQFVLGFESKLFTNWFLDIQGWNKTSSNIIGPAVANPLLKYDNSINFKARGLDFYLKKQYIGKYYGWMSYTIAQSQKQDPLNKQWRNSDSDRTHVLNIVGNVKFNNNWLIGARLQYLSGTPYTLINKGIFNQNTGEFSPDMESTNSSINLNDSRLPNFFQIDFRCDHYFLYDEWKLDLYLDVANITSQKNVSSISPSRDYNTQLKSYGFPILPNLGIIASF